MINETLNLKYPIFQGAMAHIATAEFAANVSNCGALGIIGTGAMNPEQVRHAIATCKSLTDKPFGVNVMMMNPYTEEIMQIIAEEKVAVVTTGAGNPGPYIPLLRASGCRIFPICANVALAKRLADAGVDGIIAEGTESGGHVGETTTMCLVPQIVEAVDIPVIAAGGIACGKQFNAAIALGAVGVQVGTCLLVADECPVHENYKEVVIKAKDSSTVVTGRSVNTPVRILKNQMTNEYLRIEASGTNREELEKLTLGALRKAVFDGDMKMGSVMMGQTAGIVKVKKSLKEIFESLIQDSKVEKTALDQRLAKSYENCSI